jgi:hypothetical protein
LGIWRLDSQCDRALLAASLFHLSGILILPYTGGWSFLFTGAVMVFSLLALAE